MKANNIVRILAGLSFLIFFCPFFQMCSDNAINNNGKVRYETQIEKEKRLQEKKQEVTFNGYEMGYYVFKPSNDIALKDFYDVETYAFISFTFTILSSAAILLSAFRNRFRLAKKLSVLNIILVTISMIVFNATGTLEDFSQIKFGYYLFLSNSIAIIVLANKAIKQNAV